MTEQDRSQAIPAPVEKLRHLEKFIPNLDKTTCEFGRFLADRLVDEEAPQGIELEPEGFVAAAYLAIADLQRGVDGWTGEPIKGKLTRLPHVMYRTLRLYIPGIGNAIYPEEFADQVRATFNDRQQQR
jgi:hypothetical protein